MATRRNFVHIFEINWTQTGPIYNRQHEYFAYDSVDMYDCDRKLEVMWKGKAMDYFNIKSVWIKPRKTSVGNQNRRIAIKIKTSDIRRMRQKLNHRTPTSCNYIFAKTVLSSSIRMLGS
jgi:hypothetical protein